jgi:diguanylate cyclase (GGDEF)-like protein
MATSERAWDGTSLLAVGAAAPRGSGTVSAGRVSRRASLSIGLALVTAVVVLNTVAPWDDLTALKIDDALQLGAGSTAVLAGVIAARRVDGPQRRWRLLIAAGMAGWTVGQAIWTWYQLVDERELPSPSLADVGYFMFPIFALPALRILARSTDVPRRRATAQWTAHGGVALVLDGLIVSGSVFILAWAAALGPVVRAAEPDLVAWAVAIAYPVSDVVLLVVALLLVVADRIDRRLRVNVLLLAAGVLMLACSDSIFAYLVSDGAASMQPLADAGFVLGPVFIAYAVWIVPSEVADDADLAADGADWQLFLPYAQLVLVGLLLTGQLLSGAGPGLVEGYVSILVVVGVGARQLLALLDNRLLLRRVFESQAQLTYQAHYDPLTALPNRVLFAQRLDRVINRRNRGPVGLIFVDLDDFKVVNDRFGHAGGDQLLEAVGQRLRGCLRDRDMVARLGGDEFAILLEGELDVPQAAADRIRDELRRPFAVHGSPVVVKASLGLVVVDPDEPRLTADALLGRADATMYAGKRLGKDVAVVYQGPMAGQQDFSHALLNARGGVPLDFHLCYQPIVQMSDGLPVAVEALARWTAPDGTHVSPDSFIPATEGAGLGGVLDAMVLELACRQLADAGLDLVLHVNVCASRLGDLDFEDVVAAALARHDIKPGRLILEITERVPIVDLGAGALAIRRLQAMGVEVALDDFGAGYNSLTYLHALPVDVVKLDRGLITGIEPKSDAALYRSVIGLCSDLGLRVIAEGIETAEQESLISQAGCLYGQGYRFGRPAPLAEFSVALG